MLNVCVDKAAGHDEAVRVVGLSGSGKWRGVSGS